MYFNFIYTCVQRLKNYFMYTSLLKSFSYTRISYFLRLKGERERVSLNGCSLINIPAFLPLALCRNDLASPLCQNAIGKPLGTMWLNFSLLKVYSPETPRRMLCLPCSEQPLSCLCPFSPDSTCVEVLTTGREVLLCFLNAPSFSSLTSRCLFYLFQEAQARGSG